MPQADEFALPELLGMEKEITGLYLSGHPMSEYRELSERIGAARIGEIADSAHEEGQGRYRDGDVVTLLCIVSSVKTKITKSNTTMAFVTVEDMFGSIEMLVFPKVLAQAAEYLQENRIITARGRISLREDEDAKFICEKVLPPSENSDIVPAPQKGETAKEQPKTSGASRNGLYLRLDAQQGDRYERAKNLVEIFEGDTPLYFYFLNQKRLVRAPRGMWVDVNEPLLKELRRLLGEENVAVRE